MKPPCSGNEQWAMSDSESEAEEDENNDSA